MAELPEHNVAASLDQKTFDDFMAMCKRRRAKPSDLMQLLIEQELEIERQNVARHYATAKA